MDSRSSQPRGEKKKVLLHVPRGLYDDVCQMAERKGWSRTRYIVHCVTQYIKKEKTIEA